MKNNIIPIEKILQDETFRFARRDSEKIARIEASICVSGLLEPVWVRAFSYGWQILAGFSRFEAAKAAGLSELPVRKVSTDESLVDAFYQALLAHRISAEFNIIERARILKIIQTLNPVEKLKGQYLTLLELPDRRSMLDEVEALLTLESETQFYIETYGLALKQASQFLRFNAEEQRFCAELGRALLIRPIELLAICAPLREISGRDKLSIQDVIYNLGIPDILKSDIPRGAKIGEIKKRILESRFPKLTEWNQLIESSARSMNLPENVQLKWDKTLEASGVQIQATMHSIQEVQDLAKILSSHNVGKELTQLFKVLA